MKADRNVVALMTRSSQSTFRFLLFLILVLLANNMYAQSGDTGDVLESIDPRDQETANHDILNEAGDSSVTPIDTNLLDEGEGSSFDPMDELDSIPRSRIEKGIAEKEQEIIAKKKEIVEMKDYNARMESECWCVFNPCLVLEAKLKDDLSDDARRLAERSSDAYNERAQAKKAVCRRWKEQKENRNPKEFLDTLYRKLEALRIQSDEEREIEQQLKRQRLVDESRKREAQIAAEKTEIATAKSERERLRQEAAARHQEYEARKLEGCQAKWDEGRNPCGCGHLSRAPVWVKNATTCEK